MNLDTRTGTGPFGEKRYGVWSGCGKYRYSLEIDNPTSQSNRTVVFIGMNPSTADEKSNDNTVDGMYKRVRQMRFMSLQVLNVYAIIQTDSRKLGEYEDIIGPDNDLVIKMALARLKEQNPIVLVGWGNEGHKNGRGQAVYQMIREAEFVPHCLRVNKNGAPQHPLYVPRSEELKVYAA